MLLSLLSNLEGLRELEFLNENILATEQVNEILAVLVEHQMESLEVLTFTNSYINL